MKLGIAPLSSARKELSNDVLKMVFTVGHTFDENCTRPKAIIHGFFHDFGSKCNIQQN